MALVEQTLRGRDLADLVATTRDGIEIRPLYTEGPDRSLAAGAVATQERADRGWDIRTCHRLDSNLDADEGAAGSGSGPDTGSSALAALRQRIEDDLAGGAVSLEFDAGRGASGDGLANGLAGGATSLEFEAGQGASGDGLAGGLAGGATLLEFEAGQGASGDKLAEVLSGVDLARTPVALAPHGSLGIAAALGALVARSHGTLAAGSSLGLDPLGEWARCGRHIDAASAAQWVAALACSPLRTARGEDVQASAQPSIVDGGSLPSDRALGLGTGVRAFAVDAVRYTDAGATEAQALGWATATAVVYLRALVAEGLPVDAAARLIGFRFAATADQFVTIAALRAARVMWRRVVTASGGSEEAARQYQHAVTAASKYSQRDPWVNLLRGASAALAAGVAGADAVTVLPFDHASGPVDADGALGRRLARNTQLLLLEESHLGRTADPAGGSFYVESLTEQLAYEGWRLLQEVEASGGIEAAIDSGALAATVEHSWQARLVGLRTRNESLVGVSEFPILDERVPACPADSKRASEAAGLSIRRLAEPFEDLRDAADRHHAVTGKRPAAWVAALGSAAAHSTRTAWAQNLLAAAGVEARGGTGVESPVAAAADFAASDLPAAVITGTDDMYRLRGSATAAALKDSGAAFVALACDPGTPAELIEELKSAGVDEAWHNGIDAAAQLERLHQTLGIG